MNYRKFYKETTGIDIPKNFDVHHIDGDRSNNDIMNLVAIPRNIHQAYHHYLSYNKKPISIDVNLNPISYKFVLERISYLAIATEIIHGLIVYRNYLLKMHHNYMGITYETHFDKIELY